MTTVSSLLNRAALVVAAPLSGCVLLAALLAGEWRGELQEAENVVVRTQLEVDIGRLVHALQAERGVAAAAAARVDGLGSRLPGCRAVTDELKGRLKHRLGESGELENIDTLRDVVQRMEHKLAGARRRNDAQELEPLDVLSEYSDVIRVVFDETERFAAVALPTRELAERADLYRRLLVFKELFSRERALGAVLLGTAGPKPEILDAYERNLLLQEEGLRELELSNAGSLDRRVYDQLLEEEPFDGERRRLRAALESREQGRAPSDEVALGWFERASRRSDHQQRTLERLVQGISGEAERLAESARRSFITLLSVVAALLVVLLWGSRVLSKQLIMHLEAEQRHAARVRYLARHDPLTELPNRPTFHELLEEARKRAAAAQGFLALHLIDIEDFARINRVWGQKTGDWVLVSVARRLRKIASANGVLGRLYGDQFGLIQPSIEGKEDAKRLAAEILASFSEPIAFEQRLVPVRARLGITLFPPDGETAEELLRNADLARQHVLEGGRYRFYVAEMYERYLASRTLADALRSSNVQEDFVVQYQPKIEVATNRVQGVEALVRWKRGQELLAPGAFIREAEQSGVIVSIGQWVFRQACEQVRIWSAAGIEPPVVAVNLSAVQLMQADLVESLAEILRASGVDPRSLELEITESVLTEDLKDATERLEALRALGLSLAIDDFGTGHSSFTYLQRFPVTTIKIDRSFVADLDTSHESEVIVDTVIGLAKSLDMRVVAEGVETERQLEMLREKECDEAQGFLVSRPLFADEVTDVLRARPDAAI